VAAREVGHLVGWIAGCAIAPFVLGALFGPAWIGVGIGCAAIGTLWIQLWLPRAAHRAFEATRYATALRRYRLIGSLAFTRSRTRAAVLSRAACELAIGHHAEADTLLATLDEAQLDNSERAVWLNNRACASLDRLSASLRDAARPGEAGAFDAGRDAASALAEVDRAVALRPDVPGIQHTRARALIAVGRLDDAIAVLEGMRAGGELPLRLEAERCRELAVAWERKGQRDYADDYRDRARLHAI
jgi:tetratricopeptide (TPR) repeat protein